MPQHAWNNLFLTGFMGVGKSAVGKRVAAALGWEFVDTDDRVEEMAGNRIGQIFKRSGEPTFRAWESRVLGEIAGRPRTVIALGGGTLADSSNRDLVLRSGRVVYLRANIDNLIVRLNTVGRPLVEGLSGEALRARITAMLEERIPTYELAHRTVDTDGKSVEQVASEIRAEVAAWKK